MVHNHLSINVLGCDDNVRRPHIRERLPYVDALGSAVRVLRSGTDAALSKHVDAFAPYRNIQRYHKTFAMCHRMMYTSAEGRRYWKHERHSRLKRWLEGKLSTWQRSRKFPLIQAHDCAKCSEDVQSRSSEICSCDWSIVQVFGSGVNGQDGGLRHRLNGLH
jgi:hypothetical protein